MLLTVGQLAKMTGVTVRALHHYDARGLLAPSQRSEGGYRLYAQADVVRLYRIQALQRFGLSLAEIADALEQDGDPLSNLIAQQLAALGEQIVRSTRLRDQLLQVQERLATPEGPALNDWLSALELFSTYDRFCSPEEMRSLIASNNDSAWPSFIADVRAAMSRDIDPEGDEAQALALRWSRLAMSRFGGDPQLARKMKLAYLQHSDVQSRVHAQSGFDMPMMQFCIRITERAQAVFWSRHLSAAELARFSMSAEWQEEWMTLIAGMKAIAASTNLAQEQRDVWAERWDAALLRLAGGSAPLKSKIETALHEDTDLRELWAPTPVVLRLVTREQEKA